MLWCLMVFVTQISSYYENDFRRWDKQKLIKITPKCFIIDFFFLDKEPWIQYEPANLRPVDFHPPPPPP